MMRLRHALPVLLIAVAGATALTTPGRAHACGGTFCDRPPDPVVPDPVVETMQVVQTGETIIFAVGDGFVEAHVQILYEGNEATKFAWIVPVPAIPEIEIGSIGLFEAALQATAPTFTLETTDNCPSPGISFIAPDDPGPPPDQIDPVPTVVGSDTLGVFEYVILQGGTAATIGEFLAANGYADNDEAPAILDAYIDEGHVFVAFKLQHAGDIEALHPIVLRYPGDEPCIPLRLTRIAAADDMPIRALVLGDERMFPGNWRHVVINDLRVDWSDPIASESGYDAVVTMAIDAPLASGRAFVTEYAGPSDVVDASELATDRMDPAAFVDLPVTQVIDVLTDQGLASCRVGTFPDFRESECAWGHTLVPGLLREFVPVPEGVAEDHFYACLSCYPQQIDLEAWDGEAFAQSLHEQIVAPMDHARTLLDRWPYLTLLYTRVSPHEMTTDPTFVPVVGLDDVDNRRTSARTVTCCSTTYDLPGSRTLRTEGGWPSWSDAMPWAERIEEIAPTGGAAIVLADRTAEIEAILAEQNASVDCADDSNSDSSSTGDDAIDVDDSMGHGDAPTDGNASQDESRGCACRASAPNRAHRLRSPAVLVLLSPVLRRRRRG